ncbi:MAG: permease [Ardenticatenaceae bacterium]|nr:permease [Ardenticatenaceae bacterium]
MNKTEKVGGATAVTPPTPKRLLTHLLLALIITILIIGLLVNAAPPALSGPFTTFVTIFMGIFVEAVPFLVAGSIVSGLIEVYISRDTITRFVPRNPIAAAFIGALLGFTFPVCECGVVPVTRRLYHKGLPTSVGIAFLLSAPVVNPVVILSTYTAFGWGPVLIGRLLFSILIAFTIGLIFSFAQPEEVLLETRDWGLEIGSQSPVSNPQSHRLWHALTIGGDDFLDMARYLIIGSMLAALMQTLVPQAALLALGSGPVISIIILMLLAYVLSICSTVDAFLALSFVNTFTTGSILGFLVFGPMVDIKSSLMFLSVFRRRTVAYLILLPFLLTLMLMVFVNLNVNW